MGGGGGGGPNKETDIKSLKAEQDTVKIIELDQEMMSSHFINNADEESPTVHNEVNLN